MFCATRCGKIERKKAAKIPNVQRRCNATIEQDLIELKSSRFVGHAHHGRDTRPHDCGRLYVLHVYLFVNQLNCGLVKNEFQPTNSWLLCLVIKNKPAPIVDVLVIWLTFHWWKWRRHTTRAYDHRREPIVTIVLAFALSRSRSYSRSYSRHVLQLRAANCVMQLLLAIFRVNVLFRTSTWSWGVSLEDPPFEHRINDRQYQRVNKTRCIVSSRRWHVCAYLGWFDRRTFYLNVVVYELQVRVGGHNVGHIKSSSAMVDCCVFQLVFMPRLLGKLCEQQNWLSV